MDIDATKSIAGYLTQDWSRVGVTKDDGVKTDLEPLPSCVLGIDVTEIEAQLLADQHQTQIEQ